MLESRDLDGNDVTLDYRAVHAQPLSDDPRKIAHKRASTEERRHVPDVRGSRTVHSAPALCCLELKHRKWPRKLKAPANLPVDEAPL